MSLASLLVVRKAFQILLKKIRADKFEPNIGSWGRYKVALFEKLYFCQLPLTIVNQYLIVTNGQNQSVVVHKLIAHCDSQLFQTQRLHQHLEGLRV